MQVNSLQQKTLLSVLTVCMCAILATAGFMLYHLDRLNSVSQKLNKAEQLSSKIIYLDEVLTMSARMYAYDGEVSWRKRYDIHVKKLDHSLIEAQKIDQTLRVFLLETSALNQKLVNIEILAIQSVIKWESDKAISLLFSAEYLGYKQEYAKQMDKAFEYLYQSNETLMSEHQNKLQFFVIAVILQAVIYFIIWLYLLYFLRENQSRLHALITTDTLTGLSNRREFTNVLNDGLAQSLTDQILLMFAVIDIDNFKKYNDLYGHPKGDSALISLSQILQKKQLDKRFSIFRLGGEEFGVVALVNSQQEALKWFKRLFKELESLDVLHEANIPYGRMTLSAGISYQSPHNLKTEAQIYSEADQALYKAKERGRNQVVEFQPERFFYQSDLFQFPENKPSEKNETVLVSVEKL